MGSNYLFPMFIYIHSVLGVINKFDYCGVLINASPSAPLGFAAFLDFSYWDDIACISTGGHKISSKMMIYEFSYD